MSGEPLLVTSQSRVMPGLMPDEALLLRRWLELHEGEWERVFANVRVGPGYDPGESWPEHARQMAILNTQRRIDALAERGADALIIECKWRAGASAVGQVLFYVELWQAENPDRPRPGALLVCAHIPAEVQQFAGSVGVGVEVLQVLPPA
jgi:hypothetical protein